MLSHDNCSMVFENPSIESVMAPSNCHCEVATAEAVEVVNECVFEECDTMKWEVFEDPCTRQEICCERITRSRRPKSEYIPRPLSPLTNTSLSTSTKRRISLNSKRRVYAYFHKIISKTQSSPSQVVPKSPTEKLQSRSRKFSTNSFFMSPIRNSSKKKRTKSHYLYCPLKHEKDTVEIHEERHDDVIYTITAKKSDVTNKQTPNSYDVTGSNNNLISTSKHIKGATVSHMVKRLAKVYITESEDINFLNVFFTTYRTFTNAETVFGMLLEEYSELEVERKKNEHLLRSIVRVLKAWLERYWEEDFYQPPRHSLLRNVMALANHHDGIEDENRNVSYKINPQSNFARRKNGIHSSFSGYVSAKLAVAEKRSRNNYDTIVPGHHPHDHSKTELSEEELASNAEASKQFLEFFMSGTVAEQLTSMDAKLFVNVLPHHCLAAVMCKERPATVQATKDQFNNVVFCVRATILCPGSKSSTISKLIMKWIDVAQECREMKNFSSLFAIISCLQTHAIHRLKRAWLGVSQEHTNLLEELSDLNMKDLIMKVGTAKFNTEESNISKVRKDATLRRNQGISSGIMHGTVPYLGSFLTDLVHLDTALSDHLEGGLINFEKRRRAFEVLAQLQLWQASCRSYQNIKMDDVFCQWFNSITPVSENQSFKLSELVEPCSVPLVSQSIKITKDNNGRLLTRSSDASLMLHVKKNKENESTGKLSHSFSSYSSSPLRTIKVTLVMKEQYSDNTSSTTNYKTVQINSNERANAVIKKILRQYLMPDDSDSCKNFSLIQIIEQTRKELRIPDSENVYYAMNSTELDPKFVLLENGAEIPSNKKSSTSTLPRKTHKKTHRKNNSVSMITTSAGDLSVGSLTTSTSLRTKSNHASPMKSLYKQLAFSSVGMSNSGSYSPIHARKRTESDKSKNFDDKKKKKSAEKYRSPLLTSVKMTPRRYSADIDSVIVLPVQSMTVQSAKQRGQEDYVFTRSYSDASTQSAPCSPRSPRKTAAALMKDEEDYSEENFQDIDYKWSRRRAIRKNTKSLSSAKFYLHSSQSDLDSADEMPSNNRSSTKFLTTLLSPLSKRKNKRNSKNSAKTLPSKLVPDYSNFADEEDEEAVLSPNPSEASNGSHFSDNVFDEERRSSFLHRNSRKKLSSKNYSLTLPPRITIQNPSPTRNVLSDTSSIASTDSEPSVEITML